MRITWTGSAPVGLYAISVETPVSRAELVVVCLQGARNVAGSLTRQG